MKRGLRRVLLFFVLLLLYVLLFPVQTGRELTLRPAWSLRTSQLPTGVVDEADFSDPVVPFVADDRFGYVGEEGAPLYAGVSSGRVAIAPDRFISYGERSERAVVQSPSGSLIHVIDASGYPRLVDGGVLLLGPDGVTVSRYDEDGRLLWRRSLSSTVTAIDASPQLTVAGLVGGGVAAIRLDGTPITVDAAAVGLSGVTGAVTVRADGGAFAAVTGAEEIASTAQALASIVTLYGVEAERAVPVLRREFTRSSRRSPQVLLSSSGESLLYTVGAGEGGEVRVIDLERGGETEIALEHPAARIELTGDETSVWVLSQAERPDPAAGFRFPSAVELHAIRGERLISSSFAADAVTMDQINDLLVMSVDDRVLAFRLELR